MPHFRNWSMVQYLIEIISFKKIRSTKTNEIYFPKKYCGPSLDVLFLNITYAFIPNHIETGKIKKLLHELARSLNINLKDMLVQISRKKVGFFVVLKVREQNNIYFIYKMTTKK